MVGYRVRSITLRLAEPRKLYASELDAMRRKQEREKRREQMAFLQFTKAMSPVMAVGRRVSVPEVTVTGKGRLSFSAAASKAFEGKALAAISVDYDGRSVVITPLAAVPKGSKEDDFWQVPKASKSKSVSLPGAGLCTWAPAPEKGKKANPPLYDYKAAGNQTYPVTIDEKGRLRFSLPKETPAPRPVVKRAPRKATAAAPAKAAAEAEPMLELA